MSFFEPLIDFLKCSRCGRERDQGSEPESKLNIGATVVKSIPGPRLGGIDLVNEELPTAKNCYRLVVLGSSRVGKTSIVARFLGQKFHDSYTPTIEDFHRKLYRIKGDTYQIDILDTSGNHPFPAMRRLSFLTGDLFLIVFSFESRQSFEEAIRLREQILETKVNAFYMNSTGSNLVKRKNIIKVPMVIVGNKSDKENKVVNVSEAKAYCDTQDSSCVFMDTSAKKNTNIDNLFYELFNIANLPLEMAPYNCTTSKRSTSHSTTTTGNFLGGAASTNPVSVTELTVTGTESHLIENSENGDVLSTSPPSSSSHIKKAFMLRQNHAADTCSVVTTNVCRPSIRTDLLIMQSKTSNMVKDNKKTLSLSLRPIQRSHCLLQ